MSLDLIESLRDEQFSVVIKLLLPLPFPRLPRTLRTPRDNLRGCERALGADEIGKRLRVPIGHRAGQRRETIDDHVGVFLAQRRGRAALDLIRLPVIWIGA